jgi:hypothetical protein
MKHWILKLLNEPKISDLQPTLVGNESASREESGSDFDVLQSTPHRTIHTAPHNPHRTAQSAPHRTIRTAPHNPHRTAQSAPHRTIRTAPHNPQRTAQSTTHRTIHNAPHNPQRTVAALKSRGFGKTAAYEAFLEAGCFSAWLRFAPDGIITWTDR